MKKFLLMFTMLLMSAVCFSQVTISQEDYDKLPIDEVSAALPSVSPALQNEAEGEEERYDSDNEDINKNEE